MALNDQTREAVRNYLFEVVSKYVRESLKDARDKPFHARLMPALASLEFSERSFSTRTGSWFQKVAQIIAAQYHRSAANRHLVKGEIQPAAEAHIRSMLEAMDHGRPRRVPNRAKDISEVLTVQAQGGTKREVVSDLHVLRHDGTEFYFEMKTPDPNKGQCKTMKQEILLITALRHLATAEAFAAASYNPWGDGQPYEGTYAKQFLEVGRDFLIGRQFWSIIGEGSTYDELLEISVVVGKQVESAFPKRP